MQRLTKHKDGAENVYTSPCKKQELVERLGQYEDIASVDEVKKLVEQQEAATSSQASSGKAEKRIAAVMSKLHEIGDRLKDSSMVIGNQGAVSTMRSRLVEKMMEGIYEEMETFLNVR